MENGYIKLNKYLLTTKKAGLLMQKEGVDGIGVYIILLLHLSRCEDCVGSYTPENMAILAVMAKKRPKFIRNIINNYGLFVVHGEEGRLEPAIGRDGVQPSRKTNPSILLSRFEGFDSVTVLLLSLLHHPVYIHNRHKKWQKIYMASRTTYSNLSLPCSEQREP